MHFDLYKACDYINTIPNILCKGGYAGRGIILVFKYFVYLIRKESMQGLLNYSERFFTWVPKSFFGGLKGGRDLKKGLIVEYFSGSKEGSAAVTITPWTPQGRRHLLLSP